MGGIFGLVQKESVDGVSQFRRLLLEVRDDIHTGRHVTGDLVLSSCRCSLSYGICIQGHNNEPFGWCIMLSLLCPFRSFLLGSYARLNCAFAIVTSCETRPDAGERPPLCPSSCRYWPWWRQYWGWFGVIKVLFSLLVLDTSSCIVHHPSINS